MHAPPNAALAVVRAATEGVAVRFELWFDFSCPYAYLASTQAEALAARVGAELVWRPMLLGGVFRAREVPQVLMTAISPAKARHNAADLMRWARRFRVPYAMPGGHPFRTVTALRVLLALAGAHPAEREEGYIAAVYRAYWVEGRDVGERAVLVDLIAGLGLDAEALLSAAETPAIKNALRAATDEAIARGVFGAPTFFVGERAFFGQDQLDAVEAALRGAPPHALERPLAPRATPPVELWFDLACPEAQLAIVDGARVLGPSLTLRAFELRALLDADYPPHGEPPASHPVKLAYLARRRAERFAAAGHPAPAHAGLRDDVGALSAFLEGLRLEGHPDATAATVEAARGLLAGRAPAELLDAVAASTGGARADREGMGRDGLAEATIAARALGVPGAPTWHVASADDGGLYFGHDRLGLLLHDHGRGLVLAGRRCVGCDATTPRATADELADGLAQLPGWALVDGHHLSKTYVFPDFAEALAFTDRVGAIAEAEGHHPDIHLAWGRVRLDVFTHAIDGVSVDDLVLASLLEAAARPAEA
jgi:2-hydroxychromene-2-carboxylate isomerase/pterin-4a-carbinolamine dehydratase